MREFEARVRMLEVAFAYLQVRIGKLWVGYSWKFPVRGVKKRERRKASGNPTGFPEALWQAGVQAGEEA